MLEKRNSSFKKNSGMDFCSNINTGSQLFTSCFLEVVTSTLPTFFVFWYCICFLYFRSVSKKAERIVYSIQKLAALFILSLVLLGVLAVISLVSLIIHVSTDRIGSVLMHDSLQLVAFLASGLLFYQEVIFREKTTMYSFLLWMIMFLFSGIDGYLGYRRYESSKKLQDLILEGMKMGVLLGLMCVGYLFKRMEKMSNKYEKLEVDEERTDTPNTIPEINGLRVPKVSKGGRTLWQTIRLLMPFLWPSKEFKLQILMIVSFLCLLMGRVVNVFVPLAYKRVVDDLTTTEEQGGAKGVAIGSIMVFVILRFLQGGVGMVSAIQNMAWIQVGQYTNREISVRMFHHLHKLSLSFHLNRKTGEVLRVMDRGTASIVNLMSSVLFNIAPTIVDIGVACLFFLVQFNGWFGLIVFYTMASYILATILITEWRTSYRRMMNELENHASQRAVDSLINFETVKYYGAEAYEVDMYKKAILAYQSADWKSQASLNLLNTTQNVIITLGLLAGCLLCAVEVKERRLKVGDFVLFLAYITQLYAPLNWFGTYYRIIQQNFVDMEKMLDLFNERIDVKDKKDAKPLVITRGDVSFQNVSFSYDNIVPALSHVSFTIPAGTTLALVGSSGGGKSSILRLLFRFYDIQQGSITIDGEDIRNVTTHSLRQSIGIVPQDTCLLNDTIKYNIAYGKIGASDEEIQEAAKAARIHDKIVHFPDGYETRVGERGLRLSGGEKQRIAIARTILKNPRIVVLDEATSALDTSTERQIQAELAKITENRTTLIVAHRLSTIVHAHKILVLEAGSIVESGSHNELLSLKGKYYEMWKKQIQEIPQ